MRSFTPRGRFEFCRRFFSISARRAARSAARCASIASSSRSQASWRFIACDRESCTVTAAPVGMWRSKTAVETLFTCWPPGPELRAKRSSKSPALSFSFARRAAFRV